jgi:hypothetical protein
MAATGPTDCALALVNCACSLCCSKGRCCDAATLQRCPWPAFSTLAHLLLGRPGLYTTWHITPSSRANDVQPALSSIARFVRLPTLSMPFVLGLLGPCVQRLGASYRSGTNASLSKYSTVYASRHHPLRWRPRSMADSPSFVLK